MNSFEIKNISKKITTFILGEKTPNISGKMNEHRKVAYTIDAPKNRPNQNDWCKEYNVSREYHIRQTNNIAW